MTKLRLIPLFLASSLVLGACTMPSWLPFGKKDKDQQEEEKKEDTPKKYDLTPEIVGGTDAEKTAILEALNKKPICQQVAKSSVKLYPDSNVTFDEHKYHNLKLTTKQVVGDLYVDFTWAVDENQEYFGKTHHLSDGVHDLIELKYKGVGAEDGTFSWKLAKIQCGDAVSNANIEYSAKVKNETYVHDKITIGQLIEVNDEPFEIVVDGITYKYPSTFKKIDYSENSRNQGSYSPFFTANNPDAAEDSEYYYVSIPGKVIYTSPDGNWGLLADGNNVLEFYSGSGTAFINDNWPNLAEKYIRVEGNMAVYNGNMQLSYVTKIAALSAEEKATLTEPEPLSYRTMDEAALAALKVEGFTNEKMAVVYEDGGVLMNGLAQVSGTYIEGTLKVGTEDATPDSLSNSARCTFDLKVGAQKITVAYDYHTDRDGKSGVMAALKTALKSGSTINIKGTMRYNSTKGFICDS